MENEIPLIKNEVWTLAYQKGYEAGLKDGRAERERRRKIMPRCNHGDGVTVSIGGVPVDPCVYREIQTFRNVTVHIYKCVNCGHIEIEWERQEDTEEITDEGMEE